MTISTQASKTIGRGNGATTSFTYAFLIPDASALRVSYIDTAGVITLLTPAQYNVSGLGSPNGGTVTYPLLGSPIPSGASLVIERSLPFEQTTRLEDQGAYYPRVVEAMADNLEMQIQQLANGARNYPLALTFPSVDVNPATELPPAQARAGLFFAFNGAGDPTFLPATGMPSDLTPYTALSTGGASARSLGARFADVINAKDSGVVLDGATDDTTNFMVAYNRAAAAAAKLFCPRGTLKHTALTLASAVDIHFDRTILKPAAAVALAIAINPPADAITGFIAPVTLSGFTLNGANTTNAVGIQLGATPTTGNVRLKNFQIANFAGGSGKGLWIREHVFSDVADGTLASCDNNIYMGGTGTNPTTARFENLYIKSAASEGVYIVSAYQTSWRNCVFEANRKEGVKIVTSGGQNAYMNRFDTCWFEDNWYASGLRPNVYDVTIDGSGGGAGVAGAQFVNCFHSIDGTTEKAVQLNKALFTTFEMCDHRNLAGAVKIVDANSDVTWIAYSINLGNPSTVLNNAGGSVVLILPDAYRSWSGWAPTITPTGAMTYGAVGYLQTRYKVIGKTCHITVAITGTVGGVPSSGFTLSMPAGIVPSGNNQYGQVYFLDSGSVESIGYVKVENATSTLFVSSLNTTAFAAGALKFGFTIAVEIL